jgi:hypothetical protein
MALELGPLTWIKSLKPDSIDSWDNLKKAFMLRAGTHHDLSQCKQEQNETLRSYTRRFFETRATMANISDNDVIDCFQNGFYERHVFRNFGCSHPKPWWSFMT